MAADEQHEPERDRQIERKRSRWVLWVAAVVLFAGAITLAGVLMSARQGGRVERQTAPGVEVTEPISEAELSWREFVDSAKEKCSESETTVFGFEALHEYEGQSFGVMVVGWKDSEYVVDLFRYDPKEKEWVPGPISETDYGEDTVDTEAASKVWGVPKELLDQLINEAHEAMYGEHSGQ